MLNTLKRAISIWYRSRHRHDNTTTKRVKAAKQNKWKKKWRIFDWHPREITLWFWMSSRRKVIIRSPELIHIFLLLVSMHAYAYVDSREHACQRVHVLTKDERDSVRTNSSLFARVDRRNEKLRVTAVWSAEKKINADE